MNAFNTTKFIPSTLAIILCSFIIFSCQETVEYVYPSVKVESYAACTEYDIAPNSDYPEYCECAEENHLSFPTNDVQYGKLIINTAEFGDPFQFNNTTYHLDHNFIAEFRTIVSDSSIFRWGELGTQSGWYILEFFDASNELVNRATLTSGGMLGLEPPLQTIKWGLPTHEGDSMINSLLDRYIQDTRGQ